MHFEIGARNIVKLVIYGFTQNLALRGKAIGNNDVLLRVAQIDQKRKRILKILFENIGYFSGTTQILYHVRFRLC